MEMTRLEKHFVNLKSKGEHNIELLRQRLTEIGQEKIHHVLERGARPMEFTLSRRSEKNCKKMD